LTTHFLLQITIAITTGAKHNNIYCPRFLAALFYHSGVIISTSFFSIALC